MTHTIYTIDQLRECIAPVAVKYRLPAVGLYNDLAEAVEKSIDMITTDALEDKITMDRNPWLIENVNNERVNIYG